MNNIKKIAYMGIGIALYVALSMAVQIPLIGHLKTDLGYIAFGVFLYGFGVPALLVGVIGCFLESIIFSGWIPLGWMAGQLAIGVICGLAYKKIKNVWVLIGITIASVFLGVGLIKTVIECALYNIPFAVKIAKNSVAFVADVVPMVFGLLLGKKIWAKNFK